jgi:hypothetical protein
MRQDPDRPLNQPRKVQPFSVVAFRPEEFADANVHGVANLEEHHCRFICNESISEPVYCGLPMLADSSFSFCAGHHEICSLPERVRTDRRRWV